MNRKKIILFKIFLILLIINLIDINAFATSVALSTGTCDHQIKKVNNVAQASGECVLIDDDLIFNQNNPGLKVKWFKNDNGAFLYKDASTNLCGPTSMAIIIENLLKLKMSPALSLANETTLLLGLNTNHPVNSTCIPYSSDKYCVISKSFVGQTTENTSVQKVEFMASIAETYQPTLRTTGMNQDNLMNSLGYLLTTEFNLEEVPVGSTYYVPYVPLCEISDHVYGANSGVRTSTNIANSIVSKIGVGIIQFGHFFRTKKINFGVTQYTYTRNGGHFVALKGLDYDKLLLADPSGPIDSQKGLSYHGLLSFIRDVPGSIESYIVRSSDNTSISLESEMGFDEGAKIGYLFNYQHNYVDKSIGEIDNDFSNMESDYFAIIQTYTYVKPDLSRFPNVN
jgi:hypothetical protein